MLSASAIWPELSTMMTPLEAAREVLGLHQDTVIREDKVTHLFTPDKVDLLASMGPEYYITCRYIHIAPMITGYQYRPQGRAIGC